MDLPLLLGILPQVLLDGLILGFMYALIALGYTMVYGVLEFINFAHSEIFIVGAFVGVEIMLGLKSAGLLEGPGQAIEQARALEPEHDLDADERPDDEDLRVREIDELEHAVDHRVAQRDEGVHETEDEAVQQDLGQD